MGGMTKSGLSGLAALALCFGVSVGQAQTGQNPSDFKLQPKEPPRTDPRLQGPEIDAPRDDRPPPQQRVTPPPVVVQQPTTTPSVQPSQQTQRPPATGQPQTTPNTQPQPGATQSAPSAQTQVAPTESTPTDESAPTSNTIDSLPIEVAPASNTTGAANDNSDGSFPWWLAGIGLLILGLLGGYLWGRRRKAEKEVVEEPVAALSEPVRPAQPVRPVQPAHPIEPVRAVEPVRPVAQPIPVPAPKPRAWLEIEFEPTEARSTPFSASLGYKLKVRNSGNLDAVGITVDALMTSAGEQQDAILGRFYAQDISQPIAELEHIPAGSEIELTGQFDLGTRDIHPIKMADRVLLVPLVAFSLRYDRGDGRGGQTDQAFVIGRETDPPSDRMGPFRLDLGPRHYKSVGKREHIAERRA